MITELIREARLKDTLKYYKKESSNFLKVRLIFAIAYMLLASMFIVYMQRYDLFYIPIIALIVGYKIPYYNLLSKRKKDDFLNSYLFPEFLQSFDALLPISGNVYQTFVGVLPYTREPLKGRLEDLIVKIEQGNKREDYLEFAEYIGTGESYMIMDMIYQFSEYGVKKEALKELREYISEIQKNKVDEMIERKMSSMEYLGYIPIFISLFTVIGFAGVLFMYYMGGISGSISNIGQ